MLGIEKTTPYVGLLIELGEWPIQQTMHYKKMMLSYRFLISKEGRLARKVLINQIDSGLPKNWYHEVEQAAKQYNINLVVADVIERTKSEWKKEVKSKIEIWTLKHFNSEIKTKTELRLLKPKTKIEMEPYLKTMILDQS